MKKRKREKGSALILAIVILAIFGVMSVTFIFISSRQMKNYTWSKETDIAFYRAEEGINTFINMLMNDEDMDFLSDNWGNAYSGSLNTLKFQVQILDQNNNPITDTTGNVQLMFDTTKTSVWLKSTGYYYKKGEDDYITHTGWNNFDYRRKNIKSRSIIVKLSTFIPPGIPDKAIYAGGTVSGNGNADIDGSVYSCTGIVDDGHLNINGDADTASTTQELLDCQDFWNTMRTTAGEFCSEAESRGTKTGDQTAGNAWTGGTRQGLYCVDGDLDWHGNANFAAPVDANGDGDYNDEEDIINIVVVTGNLDMIGSPTFDGILIILGTADMNNVGGSTNFKGTIISQGDIQLQGSAGIDFTYHNWFAEGGFNHKISRSVWYDCSKPITIPDPDAPTNSITVVASDLIPVDPTSWPADDRYGSSEYENKHGIKYFPSSKH